MPGGGNQDASADKRIHARSIIEATVRTGELRLLASLDLPSFASNFLPNLPAVMPGTMIASPPLTLRSADDTTWVCRAGSSSGTAVAWPMYKSAAVHFGYGSCRPADISSKR